MIDGKDISPGAITNTNVNSSAGIELKKLEKGGSGQIVVTDSAGTQKYVDLSGDVTVDTAGVATVSATISSGGAGSVGPQGPTGPQGPQGTQGIQGDQGVPGSDASVTATNVDNALYGGDTSSTGLVKRTADNTYALDSTSYSDTSHTHDGRYYTETETDTLLATKSGTSHTHGDIYYTETETDTLLAAKSGTSHTHDSRYYTETETDTLLATKSGTSHTHDDRYYTETESDTLLATKSGTSHTHDGRYYTETETDTLLATKAASSHNHTLADVTDSGGAAALDVGTATGTVCAGDDSRLSDARTPTTHTHDDRYYTETESDTLLAAKAASSHSHAATDITSGTLDTDRLDVGASSGKVAAGDHTHSSYISGNESITLSGDVTGTGSTAITCVVVDDSHSHSTATVTGLGGAAEKDVGTASDEVAQGNHTHDGRYFQETEFINASAGAGDAGKPVKLDAEGHIDTTMINDGDISFVDLDDIPSTFAPSAHNHPLSEVTDSGTAAPLDVPASGNASTSQVVKGNDTRLSDARTPSAHNHAATDITSGTLDTARLDVGASSGKVAAGDHTHSQYSTFDIDDSSALTTDVWSASKIISYLASFYATLTDGFSEHKFALEFVWGTDETGLVFTGSGDAEYGILTHSLGSKDIVVSVRSVYDDDEAGNNTNYDEDELADVGYDPFRIIANGTNTCKIMQVQDANVAGTWAITVIG